MFRKMFRPTSFILTLVMMLCCVSPVLANEDKVEITFCVGDDTLMINGTPVTVEKPYVVGEGVTLVPLRVITEAFGATVEWEGETQTITLTYPGVSIVLQIGNPVAEVNGKAETLLAAPELPTEYTMVPLRFISENFGAEVSYDEATEKITVVKEKGESEGLLVGAVDSAKIGDSYYSWSVENPVDMQMAERGFDGTYTSFENEYGYFHVLITAVPEDYDFEKAFVNTKASFQGYTLVKAEKNVSNPKKKTIHFQAKDKEDFWNVRFFATEDYLYDVIGKVDVAETEAKDELIRLMDTFDLTFDKDDTHDLSNVVDGMRTFEDEHLRLSFKVPHDFYRYSEDSVNEFRFAALKAEDDISNISFGIFSKSETGSAKTLAQKDYEHNKSMLNEKLATFDTGVKEAQYANFSGYEYEYNLDYSEGKELKRDVFFEIGAYVYNISVSLKVPKDNAKQLMNDIFNSVKAEMLDPDEVGTLIRNYTEATDTISMTFGEMTLTLPNTYLEQGTSSVAAALNMRSGITISVSQIPSERGTAFADLLAFVKNTEEALMTKSPNVKIISKTESKPIGDNMFATFTAEMMKDDELVYAELYCMFKKNVAYSIEVIYPELFYSKGNRQEVTDILKTIDF